MSVAACATPSKLSPQRRLSVSELVIFFSFNIIPTRLLNVQNHMLNAVFNGAINALIRFPSENLGIVTVQRRDKQTSSNQLLMTTQMIVRYFGALTTYVRHATSG